MLHCVTVLVYLRDDKPGLRFAGLWDFPGGGREREETPLECIQRELLEEFGFNLRPEQVRWRRRYPALHDPTVEAMFMVGDVTRQNIESIQFGSEGQRWKLVSVNEFLQERLAIPGMQDHLRDYLVEKH